MPNTQWRIAYGDYDFAIDRQTLAYSLTETKTGTVWADGLSTGWIELEERESGARTRYNFSDAKLISVAEKSSHQGKRILFGLDLLGIPIDLYFICSEKEVQLTVEANRDTKTHKVQDVGLLPGLVSVPDDGASYFALPHGQGALIRAKDIYDEYKERFEVWHSNSLVMPFVGAVRCGNGDIRNANAALSLITDSAYCCFDLIREVDGSAHLLPEFERDPERRRLDIRIAVFPHANHVAIGRAYRDKLLAERSHVTLRKKMRDLPLLEAILGKVIFRHRTLGAMLAVPLDEITDFNFRDAKKIVEDDPQGRLQWEYVTEAANRWEAIENNVSAAEELHTNGRIAAQSLHGDWGALVLDVAFIGHSDSVRGIGLPLLSVVYHDSILMPESHSLRFHFNFLVALLHAEPPMFYDTNMSFAEVFLQNLKEERVPFVLANLHRLTFNAFLVAHRFLTADTAVEEAVYSDKTLILINKSETYAFEREDVALPPQGFYVRHTQMEAHYALRVGDVTFDKPAWRIRRSNDGKPLETSEDIITQEFPV